MRRSLDLHGLTVHAAWREFNRFVTESYLNQFKSVVVITGHGQIGDEIIAWVHNHKYARGCERMNPNTGAYRIHLLKQSKQMPPPSDPVVSQLDLYKLLKKFS
jgi:hypothetical protein